MEKLLFEDYNLESCLRTLHWPFDKNLVIGYCRSQDPETCEQDYVRQQDVGRRVCYRLFGRGRYNILWIAEVADGDLGPYSDETDPKAFRPGFQLVVEMLKRGLSMYLLADATTTISTSPGTHFWLDTEVLSATGAGIITAKTERVERARAGNLEAETVNDLPRQGQTQLSPGQIWQISDRLAWTGGELDQEVSRSYGIEARMLPKIMSRCLYHWDGSVWRSIRPVWEEE